MSVATLREELANAVPQKKACNWRISLTTLEGLQKVREAVYSDDNRISESAVVDALLNKAIVEFLASNAKKRT